jgi:RsiW-degrading membrane proteinase PrsW (M82 family)
MGVLFFLIFISSIPAVAVLVWFRLARYPFSLLQFSACLLAGAASFFPALLLQNLFSSGDISVRIAGKWALFTEIFVIIAFTEELSRLCIFTVLFIAARRFVPAEQHNPAMACAAGLVAGLGFAILESAVYGASNPGIALLRAFTAAPLHGACGSRVGLSVTMLKEQPVKGLFRFLTAVIIHGTYNLMLIIPGFLPSIAAIFIVITSLSSAVLIIRNGMRLDV